MSELMTVAEVASELRLTTETIRSLIKRRELPGVRVGRVYRVRRDFVERLVKGNDGRSSTQVAQQ